MSADEKLDYLVDSSCSDKERMRAVGLYIKLSKRLGATIRELGYPTAFGGLADTIGAALA